MMVDGLSQEQVLLHRAQYGSNTIPLGEKATFKKEFLHAFHDPMLKILLAISALMIFMYLLGYAHIYEPLGTILAVLIVATVSAKTALSSDEKYRELKNKYKEEYCNAYRNGDLQKITFDDVVVGDKILLQSGNKIPADGILTEGEISINNSALNGESEECKKTKAEETYPFPQEITGDTFVDKHTLFRGALVMDGEGIMEVHKVGLQTMNGAMALQMQAQEPISPLKQKLTDLAGKISKIGYIGAIAIGLVYFLFFVWQYGPSIYFTQDFGIIFQDLLRAILLAVVIIVCAVPEGLPLMIALVLMQNTSKMLKANVLVRKAEGIETAGALNILFSDKTGTITKGALEVVELFTADGSNLSLENWEEEANLAPLLFTAIGENTQATFSANHQIIGGNATEHALLNLLTERNYRLQKEKNYSVTQKQGFHSKNKFSQVYIDELQKNFYKGAPERLIKNQFRYLDQDGNIQEGNREKLDEKIETLAKKSMRILAFGYSQQPLVEDKINDDIIIIALVALRDELRPEAKDAIFEVKQAGVQVVMITGDKLETAVAIAKDAGIMTEEDLALTSAQINQMSDGELKKKIKDIRVIARALPTDKSRMVRLCQELEMVVGMTGDGVNDAPALKVADVGFAMGSGSEVAKEAGKIVILDNNFASIRNSILYGRTIYENILKFCLFQLAVNVAAVLISTIAPFFGVEEPLKITHLLFINLIMDGLGAIMLGNEPAQKAYMQKRPRHRTEPIITKEMLAQIVSMGIWMTLIGLLYLKSSYFRSLFQSDSQFLTGFFVLFIAMALLNGFNVRDKAFGIFKNLGKNTGFIKSMIWIFLILLFIINAPRISWLGWIGQMFSAVPLSTGQVLAIILVAFSVIPLDLLRKLIIKLHH